MIRTAVREIAAQGRDATGVRLMSLDAGHAVAAVAAVAAEDEDEVEELSVAYRAGAPAKSRWKASLSVAREPGGILLVEDDDRVRGCSPWSWWRS